MAEIHFFEYEQSKLCYAKSGEGSKVMLTFHGFGQNHVAFSAITEKLENDYTIYSFDLFYHGKSHWKSNDELLTKPHWNSLLSAFLEKNKIENFSIICFSMGGKFALACLELMPHRVEKVFFIAPDGIKTSRWYSLATYPVLLQKYFESMIVKPNRFYGLLKLFQKLRLVDKGISKFAYNQMNSIKKRRRVYYSWVIFKNLQFDLIKVGRQINNHSIATYMFIGKYDKIITAEGMRLLLQHVDDYSLDIVESGHNDLIKKIGNDPELMTCF